MVPVPLRVHRFPEPVMTVGHQLPVPSKGLQRVALQDRGVISQVVEHGVLEDEEAAINQSGFRVGLL